MPLAVPMTWQEPTDHTNNCYFCMVPPLQKGLSNKKKESIKYLNIPSAIRPVPHGEGLPIPDAPTSVSYESESDEKSGEEEAEKDDSAGLQSDPNFDEVHNSSLHFITQGELHDLARDLQLPKSKAELLGSCLQHWNLLADDVKISKFHDCQQKL